jgi:hypothetical protein
VLFPTKKIGPGFVETVQHTRTSLYATCIFDKYLSRDKMIATKTF